MYRFLFLTWFREKEMIEITVTRANWLRNPEIRYKAGLGKAGLQFRQNLQRSNYGTPASGGGSGYQQTGTLANKANNPGFVILESYGKLVMEFGSTSYLKYLWFGTGLFGVRGSPITPTRARFLAWQVGGQWYFANKTRGTKWEGHKDKALKDMIQAFKDGVKNYKE
jgi:hypothetical protein